MAYGEYILVYSLSSHYIGLYFNCRRINIFPRNPRFSLIVEPKSLLFPGWGNRFGLKTYHEYLPLNLFLYTHDYDALIISSFISLFALQLYLQYKCSVHRTRGGLKKVFKERIDCFLIMAGCIKEVDQLVWRDQCSFWPEIAFLTSCPEFETSSV